jgi:hypothetical protein
MRPLLCALALSVFLACPAKADPPADAARLIGQASADGVFTVVPSEPTVAVRHTRSGLVCRMNPANTNRVIIFPQAARGEDVGCESSSAGEQIKLYATRFPFATTVAQQVQGAAAAIQQHYPGARPYQMALRASADGLPPSQSAHFVVRNSDGAQEYTRVSVAIINGWVIKLRYTAPAADDETTQRDALIADRIWASVLGEFAH